MRGGAICFPQRFGGSLNLNVHYHVVVPDGVFVREREREGAATVRFLQLPLPNRADLDVIALSVEQRVLRWLKRRGLLRASATDEPGADHGEQGSALTDCLRSSLGVGELVFLPGHLPAVGSSEPTVTSAGPRAGRRAASRRGFDIHAAVSVSASDREGRERLLRYCARAPLSLERLSELPGGRIAYAIKNPRGKQTHRMMTPIQFLARLCALIPPPRHPLIRFFGVFAPHSSWRRSVVPLRNPARPGRGQQGQPDQTDQTRPVPVPATSKRFTPANAGDAIRLPDRTAPDANAGGHFTSRIDWATLLKRIHDVNALACPCGGRLRFIALIVDPGVASSILGSVDLPAAPPPIARARSPDFRDTIPDYGAPQSA